MLSYQHGFHAGNLADVHKHALLCVMLDYFCRKDKPLSYIETHAGCGLYDLSAATALKTGEAAAGIERVLAAGWFAPDHPYRRALAQVRAHYGQQAYPGSPLLAEALLRHDDVIHLAELHPQEFAALEIASHRGRGYCQDGFELAQSLCPPTPRRGLLLMDPSYEVKADYQTIPALISSLHHKWNVGVIALWYPILADRRHKPMLAELEAANLTGTFRHEVKFPPARAGHGMTGSGLFIVNTPFGLADQAADLGRLFRTL